MNELITYQQCPCCQSAAISKVFSCKDYTVSKQNFEIWKCGNCTLRFTQHVPTATAIASYYHSEQYVSHTDTRKGLLNRVYHLVRKFTLSIKRSLINKESGKRTGHLLDVGAGTGAFAQIMTQSGWSVTGLEPDELARANALSHHGITLETLEHLPTLPTGSMDVITLWHVLEHVHDLHGYLRNFHRILKDDGVLLIAVPNYCSYDAKVYQNCWAAYDVPRHLYHFSPKSMDVLVREHGFTLTHTKPMWFDSFYVSLLSEKYKGRYGNVLKGIWHGLVSNIKALRNKKDCSSLIYVIRK